jgi:orotidine-5'-phosphate decarboxylase
MSSSDFYQKLQNRWKRSNSLVCVGLDPDVTKFPEGFAKDKSSVFAFNKAIIDATHDVVCAYKPQIAYFAALGAEDALLETIEYIQNNYPDIAIILDSKRGDIGTTAAQYAIEAFDRFKADAVTINPYMGFDSIEPFLAPQYKDKGVILLCRTSNESGADLQNLKLENGDQLYQHVAKLSVNKWNENNNVALVVGATRPQELEDVRAIVGDMPILVPGLGAQGGDAEAVIRGGKSADGTGLIINSSRGVLYASKGADFAQAARNETIKLRDLANQFR